MRSRALSLASAFSALCSTPGYAQVYLNRDQALDLACRREEIKEYDPQVVTSEIAKLLDKKNLGEEEKDIAHFFKCRNGEVITGYALIDGEIGKHMPITYIVAINTEGKISRVEMMVFRETIGSEARERAFMSQFEGKDLTDNLSIGSGIRNVTGATLSARAIAKGVKRALFLWEQFYGGNNLR